MKRKMLWITWLASSVAAAIIGALFIRAGVRLNLSAAQMAQARRPAYAGDFFRYSVPLRRSSAPWHGFGVEFEGDPTFAPLQEVEAAPESLGSPVAMGTPDQRSWDTVCLDAGRLHPRPYPRAELREPYAQSDAPRPGDRSQPGTHGALLAGTRSEQSLQVRKQRLRSHCVIPDVAARLDARTCLLTGTALVLWGSAMGVTVLVRRGGTGASRPLGCAFER